MLFHDGERADSMDLLENGRFFSLVLGFRVLGTQLFQLCAARPPTG